MNKLIYFLAILFMILDSNFSCFSENKEAIDLDNSSDNNMLPTKEGISEVTFWGKVSGDSVNFHIYLPKGYNNSTTRYRVVYQLHGINGKLGMPQEKIVSDIYNKAVDNKMIEPVIIVFPDGYKDSFWADSKNSDKPAETNIVKEIIPFVDSAYRTVPDRDHRIIQGFSMGGFGAAKFATKFPQLFSLCILYDAALLNWQEILARHANLAKEIFNNDSTVFNMYSPWKFANQNSEYLKNNTQFRMIVGAIKDANLSFYNYLQSLGILIEKADTDCPHAFGCLIDTEGIKSIHFIATHLDKQSNKKMYFKND